MAAETTLATYELAGRERRLVRRRIESRTSIVDELVGADNGRRDARLVERHAPTGSDELAALVSDYVIESLAYGRPGGMYELPAPNQTLLEPRGPADDCRSPQAPPMMR